jgi:1-deoxy-D-xylulose-5-phosphate reductoisomerase
MEVQSRGVVPAPGERVCRRSPLRVVLLGATGSIGRQTVDVVRKNPGRVELVGLAANRSVEEVVALAREFPTVRAVAFGDASQAGCAALQGLPAGCSASFGADAVAELAALDGADCVLNALVGFSGMRASYTALASGRELALANKESLVVAGDLIMPLARPGTLLPVDSEHAAIFQCFAGEDPWEAERIWLTASGGPFFGRTRAELAHVTAAEALKHPNWSMGPKVTVDSSTLMNKGLEAIEAHHLFDMPYERIRIAVQRQSAVHSMVEYRDGSVIAHLGATDMRVPISYALSYPRRWPAPATPVDFCELGRITFDEPDLDTFGCLRVALEAGARGGVAPCAMNAADEVAVAAFLEGRLDYLGIERVVRATVEAVGDAPAESLDQLAAVDADARAVARELVAAGGGCACR